MGITPGSPVYEALLEIGQEKSAKLHIVKSAKKRLGDPDEGVRLRLDGITDLDRLERLFDRATEASSWDDLLDTP